MEEQEEKKIYWGVGPLPEGKRRPTMREAVEAGKVGYYGINKVDSKTLQLGKVKKQQATKKEDLRAQMVGIKSKVKSLTKDLQRNISAKEKQKIQNEINKLTEEFNQKMKVYKSDKKEQPKKETKQGKAKKQLECSTCNKTFAHSSSLSRHRKKFNH